MKVEELEKLAGKIGLLIKIQVRETLGLCFFRIVIAEQKDNIIKIWAEMKGWTFFNIEVHSPFISVPAPPQTNLNKRSTGLDPTSFTTMKPINLKYLTSFLL